MSDRLNLPRPAPEVTEDGIPSIEEIPADVLLTGDPLEGELPPLDRPQAAKDWGTTSWSRTTTRTASSSSPGRTVAWATRSPTPSVRPTPASRTPSAPKKRP